MSDQVLQRHSCVELLDGAKVLLRRLEPRDADQVVKLYESLSDEQCYFRFFALHPVHLQDWARSLTEASNDQYAIGAFESGKLLGVANYVKDPAADCAEVAIVVAYSEQLRGVGTELLRRLGQIALSNGVRRLVAGVLVDNHPMLRMLADSGWPYKRRLDSSVLHVEVDLDSVTA